MKLSEKASIKDSLEDLHKGQFTGTLNVKNKTGLSWGFHFYLGEIIWSYGGGHPNRSFLRNLQKFNARIDGISLTPESNQFECPDHLVLNALLRRGILSFDRLQNLIHSKIAEDIFDILQHQVIGMVSLESNERPASFLFELGLRASLVSIDFEETVKQAVYMWSSWQARGYTFWMPSMAPILEQKADLKQIVSESTYQNLERLVDGTRTLRCIATQMSLDTLRLTDSLAPYIREGHIELIEIADTHQKTLPISPIPQGQLGKLQITTQRDRKPLIACIDDSAQICKVMQLILTKAGYDFIGIQDPLAAIATFVERRPNIIFLDLNMPVVNGYEVCAQIRRVVKLKDIPIIILTGNDGIIDRVRSKVVGASGFVAKPISQDKILLNVQKSLNSRKELVFVG